jgi:FkbM family methyltransferase
MSLFKRPFYNTASFIIKLMRWFQEKQDKKIRTRKGKVYNSLFQDKNSFVYDLTTKLKINLYSDSVLSKIIYNGFEKEELSFVKEVLTDGDIFIDIGANVGLFSLIASDCIGATGSIVSFEPSPVTFNRLQENITLNAIENSDLRNIALSNQLGETNFYISDNGYDAWDSFAPSQDNKLQKTISVAVSSLDKELEQVDKSRIKLVKIDVEGWEKYVIMGGENLFRNYAPVVMVEFTEENTFNAGYAIHEIYDLMVDYGYVWHKIKDGKLIHDPKRLHYPYNNLIAIKK